MVNENMATAASVHIAEKGKDPRAFALVATGGAGPVHATAVARKIGLGTVIVPPDAGVASAIGLLNAPPRFDAAHSQPVRLESIIWEEINDILDSLESTGRSTLRATGIDELRMAVERSVDLRYVNQGHEVLVPLPDGALRADHLDVILNAFASEYRERFNRTIPGVPVEAITWRVSVRGPVQRTSGVEFEKPVSTATTNPFSQRQVFSQRLMDYESWPVYRRRMMRPGHEVTGPAIVEDVSSTTVICHNDRLVVDGASNLIITVSKEVLS
jgi:N-methylhydantoinase A